MIIKFKYKVLTNEDSKKQLINYFFKHRIFNKYINKDEEKEGIKVFYSSFFLYLKFEDKKQFFLIFLHFQRNTKEVSIVKKHISRFFKKVKKYSKLFLLTTDTLVGLGTFVNKPDLKTIYLLKRRPLDKKIIILIGKVNQLKTFISQKNFEKYQQDFDKYWPGSTSLIIEKQGFRIPNNTDVQNLLLQKGPAFVSSANISNQNNLTLEEATKKFTCILNVYNLTVGNGTASTIIDLKTKKVLR
ncbi:Sua5/YciO/YrdC/YwlC family protein [Mycoplasma sp. 1654_15]|uniref:Sua5/YciO/YrdC/YwlC family protein n=1 Tax=Mycoplasma sp. 1654_15 TaxID=2725994 RepID=UPI001448FCAE|nr:Sua5/YciO/YrdC/YwlC family protein [Mycoplasma sp. 1654_15]QJB70958.1 translation factor Sua5 [Mycoplasma sp. 1654_15]